MFSDFFSMSWIIFLHAEQHGLGLLLFRLDALGVNKASMMDCVAVHSGSGSGEGGLCGGRKTVDQRGWLQWFDFGSRRRIKDVGFRIDRIEN